ncbi:WXG100 family type VII secretion target [Crossiella sp. CA198]|uniref:WXG100 family type VII secretion target n=1 Tax=Crossiella sp. CA198 TaxID=3455607 RepID=UPI003F8D8338
MNDAVQRANERIREVDEGLKKFFVQVRQGIDSLPEPLRWIVPRVDLMLEPLVRQQVELGRRIDEVLDAFGDHKRVKRAAEQWSAQIAGKLNDIAGDLDQSKMETTMEWEGRAAEAYRLTIPTQVSGLTGLKDLASQMRASLVSLGNSLEGFVVGVIIAIGIAAVSLITGLALIGTVAGIPVGVVVLLTALPIVLGLLGTLFTALLSHVNTCKAEQSSIQEKLRMVGTTWSQARIGQMGDASVLDGDGSDWKPR